MTPDAPIADSEQHRNVVYSLLVIEGAIRNQDEFPQLVGETLINMYLDTLIRRLLG